MLVVSGLEAWTLVGATIGTGNKFLCKLRTLMRIQYTIFYFLQTFPFSGVNFLRKQLQTAKKEMWLLRRMNSVFYPALSYDLFERRWCCYLIGSAINFFCQFKFLPFSETQGQLIPCSNKINYTNGRAPGHKRFSKHHILLAKNIFWPIRGGDWNASGTGLVRISSILIFPGILCPDWLPGSLRKCAHARDLKRSWVKKGDWIRKQPKMTTDSANSTS